MKPTAKLEPTTTERGFEYRVRITTDEGSVSMSFDDFVDISHFLLDVDREPEPGSYSPVNEVPAPRA